MAVAYCGVLCAVGNQLAFGTLLFPLHLTVTSLAVVFAAVTQTDGTVQITEADNGLPARHRPQKQRYRQGEAADRYYGNQGAECQRQNDHSLQLG